MNEARLVLPIPPGTHWKDAKPIVLPALSGVGSSAVEGPGAGNPKLQAPNPKRIPNSKSQTQSKPIAKANITHGALRFAAPMPAAVEPASKAKRAPRPKAKNDPRLVAAARELRDRWMEEINSGRYLPEANGKYEVSRAIEHSAATIAPLAELPAPLAA